MFYLLAASALLLACAGAAGGIYLACRYSWPKKLFDLVFGAPA